MSRQNRRAFLRDTVRLGTGAASLATLAACGFVEYRPQPKVARVGYLAATSASNSHLYAAFVQRLGELGWVEGHNLTIEWRYTEGNDQLGPVFAAELVKLQVDVLVAGYTPNNLALKQATSSIPIVFTGENDPVAIGLVASLAKPGGNVTGISLLSPQLGTKRVDLIAQTVPGLSLLAILDHSSVTSIALEVTALRSASDALGLQVLNLNVSEAEELESTFDTALATGAQGLIVPSGNFFSSQRARIVDLAAKSHLPAMYAVREYVEAGGLMSYGPYRINDFRRSAEYVDRILRGARASDLPVEQPTVFDLVVNTTTLHALGLTIPPSVLPLVTEWIQ